MGHAHPIWGVLREQGRYNLVWLAERTGFSHSHVKAMATDRAPCSPRFRRECARVLQMREADLFHSDSSTTPDEPGEDDRAGIAGLGVYATAGGAVSN